MMGSMVAKINGLGLFVLLAVVGAPVSLFSDTDAICPYPVGKKIDGEIQFDAILTLNAPLSNSRIMLFVRYYVSNEAIAYDLSWTEPAWMSINFPYQPFQLSAKVNTSEFDLYSHIHDKTWNHALLNTSRGVFPHILNSYYIEDQRFTFIEYFVTRLNATQYLDSQKSNQQQVYSNPLYPAYSSMYSFSDGGIDVARVETYGNGANETIISKKTVNYQAQDGKIETITANLHQYDTPASGFTVNVNSPRQDGTTLTRIPATYHRGGRTSIVSFENVDFSEDTEDMIQLPCSLYVYKTGEMTKGAMRKAVFMNYKKLPLGTIANRERGKAFLDSDFEILDKNHRQLANQYWYTDPAEVLSDDVEWLKNFSEVCMEKLGVEKVVCMRLKYINRKLLSEMLSGNHERIINCSLPLYFSTLNDNGLNEVAFVSLHDLVWVFLNRNQATLLQSLYDSRPVLDCLLNIPFSILKEKLEYDIKVNDPIISQFFVSIDNDLLKQKYSVEEAFLTRYYVAKIAKNLLQEQEIGEPFFERTAKLFSLLNFQDETLDSMYQKQKNMAELLYEELKSPSEEFEQMCRSLSL